MLKWPPEGRGWGIVFFGGLLKPDCLSYMSGMTSVWSFPKVKRKTKWYFKVFSSFSDQRPTLQPCKPKWWWHVKPGHPAFPPQLHAECFGWSDVQTFWKNHSHSDHRVCWPFSHNQGGDPTLFQFVPNQRTPFQWTYYLIWWLYFQCFRTTNWDQTSINMERG